VPENCLISVAQRVRCFLPQGWSRAGFRNFLF